MHYSYTYTFYSDPGHSWLEVPAAELSALGLKKTDFSPYSYQNGTNVYLEEDCDATKFIEAAKNKGIKMNFSFVDSDYESPIRDYKRIK